MADETGAAPTDRDIARAALIQSVVSNAAMLAVVLAVNVAIAKKDTITRAARRAAGTVRQDGRNDRISRELAEFRRTITDLSHADLEAAPDEP